MDMYTATVPIKKRADEMRLICPAKRGTPEKVV
jgi:hypothetical protein